MDRGALFGEFVDDVGQWGTEEVTADGLVPHAMNSVAMFEALRAAGTPTDLRLYDGMAHEFVRLPGMMDATVHDVASFFDRHMVRSEEFAVALGEAAAVWAERVAARG